MPLRKRDSLSWTAQYEVENLIDYLNERLGVGVDRVLLCDVLTAVAATFVDNCRSKNAN